MRNHESHANLSIRQLKHSHKKVDANVTQIIQNYELHANL